VSIRMTTEPNAPLRIGVVGFGAGGLHFHAPFIEAADGVELAGVVTQNLSDGGFWQTASPVWRPTTHLRTL